MYLIFVNIDQDEKKYVTTCNHYLATKEISNDLYSLMQELGIETCVTKLGLK